MREAGEQPRRLGARVDDAAAGVKNRPLGGGDDLDRLGDELGVALDLGIVRPVAHLARLDVAATAGRHVLGHVDDDRSGTAAARDVERLVDDPRQVVDPLDQVVVLGARPGDADRVGLLEGVVADEMGRYLAGEADHRDAVHQRVGQAGDAVGGAGTRGDEHHADLAGRARVALGRVHRALLVADQDVAQPVLLEDRVVNGKNGAAGVAEHHLDALVDQRPDHHLGAGHFRIG